MEQGSWVLVLHWVCRLTAFIAPSLSIRGTYLAWRNRALGAGGRRPEPTLAALMCSGAWFFYGIRVADDKLEPVILNTDLVGVAREAQAHGVTLSTTETTGQPRRRRPATDDASTSTAPAGQHAPAPSTHRNGAPTTAHQPVEVQPRRSPRFQAHVPTTSGGQLPSAPPAHSNGAPTTGGDQVAPASPTHNNDAPTSTDEPVPQTQPTQSPLLQDDAPTTGGDQVPSAPSAHINDAPTSANQPVAQPQEAVPTTGGDQVPPATPSASSTSSRVPHTHGYMTRQRTRANQAAHLSINIPPDMTPRGADHTGRF